MTASLMEWELNTLDITAAFLQGNEIESELYIQPPKVARRYIWKLKRCIYGLTCAPRAWYNKTKQLQQRLSHSQRKTEAMPDQDSNHALAEYQRSAPLVNNAWIASVNTIKTKSEHVS